AGLSRLVTSNRARDPVVGYGGPRAGVSVFGGRGPTRPLRLRRCFAPRGAAGRSTARWRPPRGRWQVARRFRGAERARTPPKADIPALVPPPLSSIPSIRP